MSEPKLTIHSSELSYVFRVFDSVVNGYTGQKSAPRFSQLLYAFLDIGDLDLLLDVPSLLYYTIDLGIDRLVIQAVILPSFLAKAFLRT